jgi:hypothetical protein
MNRSMHSKTLPLESSSHVIKSVSVDKYLPSIKGAGRQRSHTALGLAGIGGTSSPKAMKRSISADPLAKGMSKSNISGDLSADDLQVHRAHELGFGLAFRIGLCSCRSV